MWCFRVFIYTVTDGAIDLNKLIYNKLLLCCFWLCRCLLMIVFGSVAMEGILFNIACAVLLLNLEVY